MFVETKDNEIPYFTLDNKLADKAMFGRFVSLGHTLRIRELLDVT